MTKNLKKHILQLITRRRFVYRLPDPKAVFLTFDDGPDKQFTEKVLEVLARFSSKATFFLVGENAERCPDLVRALNDRGHRIGLHTHSHKTIDSMDREEFDREIRRNREVIHRAIGETPSILRPPKGQLRLLNVLWAARNRLTIIHYTITSNDWKARSAGEIQESVNVAGLRGGEILSFHDNNPHTLSALPALLESITRAGFACRPISIG